MFLTFRDSTHTTVIVNQFAGGLVQGIQSAISNFRVSRATFKWALARFFFEPLALTGAA